MASELDIGIICSMEKKVSRKLLRKCTVLIVLRIGRSFGDI